MGMLTGVSTTLYLFGFYTDDISMLNHSYVIDNFWRNEDGTIPQFEFSHTANLYIFVFYLWT